MATTQAQTKPPKSGVSGGRRKISLPWFRQASIGEKLTKLRLPRQNTVDVPSSHSAPATAPVTVSGSDRSGALSHFRRKQLSAASSLEV